MLVLDDAAVRRLLRPAALREAMRRALADFSAGRAVQPLRTVMELPQPGSLLFVKPALAGGALVTKLITQMPANAGRGLPTLLATIVLLDDESGAALAVIDATWLTEQRTAAVSALGADLLAPPAAKVVALLGSGALARSHASALREVRSVSELRIWSRNPDNVRRCAAPGSSPAPSSPRSARRAPAGASSTTRRWRTW